MSSKTPDFIAEAKRFRARTPFQVHTVDRAKWPVIDKGRGKEVLFLCPGTLGRADIFRNVIDHFAKRMRVISATYPMIGDVVRIADGAVHLLDRLGIDRAHFLGSSLGGVVVQTIAARHPERVGHAFIANSLAGLSPIRATFPSPEAVETMAASQVKGAVRDNVASWPEPAPEFAALKRFLHDELANQFTGRAFKARVLALVRMKDIPTAAIPEERITILQADDDPLISPAARKTVTDRYAKAFVHSFKTGGHFPYITRAADYCRVIEERLRG